MTQPTRPYRRTDLQGITDLTVLAPIEPGFIPGTFETESRRERLQRVLAVLNAIRKTARESEVQPSPFPDPIGRFAGIHFFRFAVVPGPVESAEAEDRLLLNVTFDGGWEPYMHLIWKPLGRLLDLIFCHCVSYPMAYRCSFDDYVAWVRAHEVPGQFFYADGPGTVGDRRYGEALEDQQLRTGGAAAADRQLAGLAVSARVPAVEPTPPAVEVSLRALQALGALRPLFPLGDDHSDGAVLLRFAQDLLADLRRWVSDGLFDPGAPFHPLRQGATGELVDWLMRPAYRAPAPATRLDWNDAAVQPGIATPHDTGLTHGVLLLLRVEKPSQAQKWLRTFSFDPADNGNQAVHVNLALTFSGLRALGVPDWRLARLPLAFVEGMEARAGVLGDVRGNHPRQWQRPPLANGEPLNLSTVHVLLQWRTRLADAEVPPTNGDEVLKRLADHADTVLRDSGLSILATQPLRAAVPAADGQPATGHMGFADGLSQPTLAQGGAAPAYWRDRVAPGELFLGHPGDRDRHVVAPLDADALGDGIARDLLLDNASFLVVRKLRQHLDRLDVAVDAAVTAAAPPSAEKAAELRRRLLAAMMGRQQDGRPLALTSGPGGVNDFDYRHDAQGERCPHRSHVRRANPRQSAPGVPLPRIARRGMSYGLPAADDRGIVFMAYNAHLDHQFEVIQHWLAGGNASGVSSSQDDPFVGVPVPGRTRVFRCVLDDQVHRVELGDVPLVSLQWGLYALAPSPAALQNWNRIVDSSEPKQPDSSARPPDEASLSRERWRQRLEDRNTRDAGWALVRKGAQGVRDGEGYGVLVGGRDAVGEVLRDHGARFSTSGYGDRMDGSDRMDESGRAAGSIGRGYLGQDRDGRADRPAFAESVNLAIETVGFDAAFDAARVVAAKVIEGLRQASRAPDAPVEVSLPAWGSAVLGVLCQQWFGLPDATGRYMKIGGGHDRTDASLPAECPGHFLRVSRYVFSTPHPGDSLTDNAIAQGQSIRQAVGDWLRQGGPQGPLAKAILGTMNGVDDGVKADTLAGIMLGFPPTTLGNLVGVLKRWTDDGRLWELQRQWRPADALEPRLAADAARLLRDPALEAMAEAPVPFAVWRKAAADLEGWQGLALKKDLKVVVGLGSAMQDTGGQGADPMLMFGGARHKNPPYAHACPGYAMAMGVMTGAIAALLEAGALEPAAPLTLRLRPHPQQEP